MKIFKKIEGIILLKATFNILKWYHACFLDFKGLVFDYYKVSDIENQQ